MAWQYLQLLVASQSSTPGGPCPKELRPHCLEIQKTSKLAGITTLQTLNAELRTCRRLPKTPNPCTLRMLGVSGFCQPSSEKIARMRSKAWSESQARFSTHRAASASWFRVPFQVVNAHQPVTLWKCQSLAEKFGFNLPWSRVIIAHAVWGD